MKNTLTVAYVTSRFESMSEWFLDSLRALPGGKECDVIIVDPRCYECSDHRGVHYVHPKPTVWQGPHRLTKDDWWAASNARNTALCLCNTEWIAFVDDRSVLMPHWLEAINDAMIGLYAVCGPYQKVHNLKVSTGAAVAQMDVPECGYTWDGKKTDGKDNRLVYVDDHYKQHAWLKNPYNCPGSWWYGCSNALPVEWALQVNGYDETCDGLGSEDSIFGLMLENNGFPIKYDLRLAIVEDRTPGHLDPVMIRKDKGVSPNDKSHWLLAKLKSSRKALHQIDLRQLQACALAGRGFPVMSWPNKDPYDGEPLSQMQP